MLSFNLHVLSVSLIAYFIVVSVRPRPKLRQMWRSGCPISSVAASGQRRVVGVAVRFTNTHAAIDGPPDGRMVLVNTSHSGHYRFFCEG